MKFLKRLYEVNVKSFHFPYDSIGLFKMSSCRLVYSNTAASGETKHMLFYREHAISRIHPFAVIFRTSINVYTTNGILLNGLRATQHGVPALETIAFS